MPGQRTTVAKGFQALGTRVWSFACMHARMHGQRGSLDEFLAAFVAFIWPVPPLEHATRTSLPQTGMYSFYKRNGISTVSEARGYTMANQI
jgi:hypothetical protein